MATFGNRFYEEFRPQPFASAPSDPYGGTMEQMPTYGAGQNPHEQLTQARAQWLSELFDAMEYKKQMALQNMQQMYQASQHAAVPRGQMNPGMDPFGYNSSPARAVVGADGMLQWSQTGPTSGGAIQETRSSSPGGPLQSGGGQMGSWRDMTMPGGGGGGPLPSIGQMGVKSAFPGMKYGQGRGRMGGGSFGGFGGR